MDTKKRLRQDELEDEELLMPKRPRTTTDSELHHVNKQPHEYHQNEPYSLIESLITGESEDQVQKRENDPLTSAGPVSGSISTLSRDNRLKKPLHTISSTSKLSHSSLFQTASSLEGTENQTSFSPHGLASDVDYGGYSTLGPPEKSLPVSSSLFSSARSLKPSLHSIPPSNGFSAPQKPSNDALIELPLPHSEPASFSELITQLPEDEEFEAILASAKARQSAPARQLHQPKPLATSNNGITTQRPSSSLFQSARTVDAPLSSHASPPSSSLFSKASSLKAEAETDREGERAPAPEMSSSLFSSARSLPKGSPVASAAQTMNLPDVRASTSNDLNNTEYDDFEAMMDAIRSKRQQEQAPRFNLPLKSAQSARQIHSGATGGSSLFQSAKTLPSADSHVPPTGIASKGLENAAAAGAEGVSAANVDEEDEFELFMKNLSEQRKSTTPAPVKRPNASAAPNLSAPSAAKYTPARQKMPPGPRRFKAPAVINPVSNHKETAEAATLAGNDDVEGALLSLLEDEEEEMILSATPASTPVPPISPSVSLRTYGKSPLGPTKSENLTKPVARVLPEEHADLLEGIDSEDPVFLTPTTPKSTASNKRFYTSQTSQSPQSPSSPSANRCGGPGLSNRGVVRSSPYSITAAQAMPIVTSTPTKIMEISSPVRLQPTPTSIPSPNNANKRSRPAFTSPPQVSATGSGTSENLRKKQKNILYGRTAAYTSQSSTTTPIAKPKPLFDLYPSDELKASRQPLTSLGRAPHGSSRAQLLAYKMRPELVDMTSVSAKHYVFEQLNEEGVLQKLKAADFFEVLLREGASPKYLTLAWVENHYRWIVWKLASMERSFPQEFTNTYLTPERVLAQLKYRYEREINRAQRPPLRKILEHDAAASSHVVFMISAIKHDGSSLRVTGDDMNALAESGTGGTRDEEEDPDRLIKSTAAIVEVSDGWYSVNAILDPYLTRLVQDKLIFVGQKLHIFGASIVGNDNPTSPLEVTASTMLKLGINGVRRARWSAKLGFHARTPLPAVRIASLKIGGGIAPKLDALILRVYPLTFTEEIAITPNPDEPSKNGEEAPSFFRLTRSSHGEDIAMERYTKRREDWYEKTKRDLTLEILHEAKQTSLRTSKPSGRPLATNDSETEDPESEYEHMNLEGALTPSQQAKLEERLREASETESWLERQVSPSIRVLICDYPGDENAPAASIVQHLAAHGAEGLMTLTASQKKALHSLGKAVLTIYNINEDLLARLKEGSRIQTSFIAYKGDPVVLQKSNVSNFSAADDAFTLQSENEIYVAPLARLTTTTYTGFEFISTKNDEIAKTLVQLFSRVATHFDCLDSRLKLRDIPPPSSAVFDFEAVLEYERRKLIDRFTVSNEFDGVGLVMSVLPKAISKRCKLATEPELNALKDEYHMDVFLADPSGNLLSLRIEAIQDNLPSPFSVGSILCFKNAIYDGYDEHLGLHSAITSEATEWVTKVPSAPHLKQRRDEILAWMDSMDITETMELLASKIVDISSGAITKSKPGIDTTNAIFTAPQAQIPTHHMQISNFAPQPTPAIISSQSIKSTTTTTITKSSQKQLYGPM